MLLLHSKSYTSVQLLSRVRLFATPWIAARQASLSITNSQSSLKLTSIESVLPSSHLVLSSLLLLPPIQTLFSLFFTRNRVFCLFDYFLVFLYLLFGTVWIYLLFLTYWAKSLFLVPLGTGSITCPLWLLCFVNCWYVLPTFLFNCIFLIDLR